jgi:hypothetical protein
MRAGWKQAKITASASEKKNAPKKNRCFLTPPIKNTGGIFVSLYFFVFFGFGFE